MSSYSSLSSSEPDLSVDDLAMNVIQLGKIFMDVCQKINPNNNNSLPDYVFENIRNSISALESNYEYKNTTSFISSTAAEETLFQTKNDCQKNEAPKNKWSKFKRVECPECRKKVLEIFLRKHLRMHRNKSALDKNLDDIIEEPNKFNIELSENRHEKVYYTETLAAAICKDSKLVSSNSTTNERWPPPPFQKRRYTFTKYKFSKYNPVSCSICGKSILECFFPKHLRMHKKTSQVNCKFCDKIVEKSKLFQHTIDFHEKNVNDNVIISSTFLNNSQPSSSPEVQQNCNNNNNNACDICGVIVEGSVKRHLWAKHRIRRSVWNGPEKMPNPTELPPLSVKPKPAQRYSSVSEKVVMCFICHKEKTPYTIQKHFLKHCNNDNASNPRVLQSDKIKKRNLNFGSADENKWEESAANLRRLHCTVCQEFVPAAQFNSHMKNFHNGSGFRYRCSICDAGFMRLRGCRVHIGHAHKNCGAKALFAKWLKSELDD